MDKIKMIIGIVSTLFGLLVSFGPTMKRYINRNIPLGVSERTVIRFMDVVEENKQFRAAKDPCAARIAGGEITTADTVPYLVSLRYFTVDNKWFAFCGGSLITYVYVLTAAHCLYSSNLELRIKVEHVRIVSGAHYSEVNERQYARLQNSKVKSFWRHPKYRNFENDIALLEARKKFKRTKLVQPLRLKTPDINPSSLYCLLSGFGKIKTVPSKYLRMVCMHLVHPEYCADIYRSNMNNDNLDMYVCAGGNGKDAGPGDSGGPLVCSGYQIGIVAFGGETAEDPGVYMKIEHYMRPDLIFVSKADHVELTVTIIYASVIVSTYFW